MNILNAVKKILEGNEEPPYSERFMKLKDSVENDPDWDFGYSRWTDKYYATIGGFCSGKGRVQFTGDRMFKRTDCNWMTDKESRDCYKLIKKGRDGKLPSQIKDEEERQKENENKQINFIDNL